MHRISRSLSQYHRLLPTPCYLTRFHSTNSLASTVSNDMGRLRFEEEKYTTDLSSPFPAPIQQSLSNLVDETVKTFSNAHMMVSETQGKLLYQLTQLINARRVLELDTFTGYSTLAMASTLPDNDTTATVISLDRNEQAQAVAKKYIQEAQLENKVDFRLGKALDLMQDLVQEDPSRQFDLIFLDANKSGYISYFDYIMDHNMLADRGIMIADNVLFFGQVHRVAGYSETSSEASKNILSTAKKAHKFNQHVLSDPRVQVVVLPIFDGVSIIRKR